MAKTTHRSKKDKALQKSTAELFRTPDETYKALFKQFPFLVEGNCLDPSCGDGRFIEYIFKRNKGAHMIYDIRASERVAWKTKGLVKALGKKNCRIVPNWLDEKRPRKFGSIITNPPFSLACEFVEKGLKWVEPNGFVTVLHRLNWLGTGERSRWQQSMPLRYVINIANRPKFELDSREKNTTDTYEYAWFCYQRGYKGEPTIKWCHSR